MLLEKGIKARVIEVEITWEECPDYSEDRFEVHSTCPISTEDEAWIRDTVDNVFPDHSIWIHDSKDPRMAESERSEARFRAACLRTWGH